jgi:hypothetical protein
MAELADALDLGSSRETCGGSIPPSRIKRKISLKDGVFFEINN